MKLGLLHPGQMGVSVGQTLRNSGHQVYWRPAGRSDATHKRAAEAGFSPIASLAELCESVAGLVSVCPPEQALSVARAVSAQGFTGLYLDANAVAPATAGQMASLFAARYVDGGIIGPPALQPGSTRLYLAGDQAHKVVDWFSAGPLSAIEMASVQPGAGNTDASLLKMAYAAYSKGVSALLLDVCALAEAGSVSSALQHEWSLSMPRLQQQSAATAAGTAPKAWRFAGEMQEIAATFAAFGLPDQFHQGASEVYRRMAPLKNLSDPDLNKVIDAITASDWKT